VVKPNREELAEVAGRALETLTDVVDAARSLLARGVGNVLVSLGSEGALLVTDGLALHARTEPVTPRSTVGAGDATLAGFLGAGGDGPEALRAAVGWGTAAVRLPGTEMPGPADIDIREVTVAEFQAGRALGGRRCG
jgi:1-phosphofructokinase